MRIFFSNCVLKITAFFNSSLCISIYYNEYKFSSKQQLILGDFFFISWFTDPPTQNFAF